jgi:hypothetical protein
MEHTEQLRQRDAAHRLEQDHITATHAWRLREAQLGHEARLAAAEAQAAALALQNVRTSVFDVTQVMAAQHREQWQGLQRETAERHAAQMQASQPRPQVHEGPQEELIAAIHHLVAALQPHNRSPAATPPRVPRPALEASPLPSASAGDFAITSTASVASEPMEAADLQLDASGGYSVPDEADGSGAPFSPSELTEVGEEDFVEEAIPSHRSEVEDEVEDGVEDEVSEAAAAADIDAWPPAAPERLKAAHRKPPAGASGPSTQAHEAGAQRLDYSAFEAASQHRVEQSLAAEDESVRHQMALIREQEKAALARLRRLRTTTEAHLAEASSTTQDVLARRMAMLDREAAQTAALFESQRKALAAESLQRKLAIWRRHDATLREYYEAMLTGTGEVGSRLRHSAHGEARQVVESDLASGFKDGLQSSVTAASAVPSELPSGPASLDHSDGSGVASVPSALGYSSNFEAAGSGQGSSHAASGGGEACDSLAPVLQNLAARAAAAQVPADHYLQR